VRYSGALSRVIYGLLAGVVASIISWKAGAKQTSDFLTRGCADGL
jgi:hypothetical protein